MFSTRIPVRTILVEVRDRQQELLLAHTLYTSYKTQVIIRYKFKCIKYNVHVRGSEILYHTYVLLFVSRVSDRPPAMNPQKIRVFLHLIIFCNNHYFPFHLVLSTTATAAANMIAINAKIFHIFLLGVATSTAFTFHPQTCAVFSAVRYSAPRGTEFGVAAVSSSVVLKSSEASREEVDVNNEEAVEGEEKKQVEEEEEEEDPEIKAIKEEIASLEATLRSKRMEANRLEDQADDYTQGGYLRKCAEMDNFRKRRDLAFQNSKYVARASIVQRFLPVMDELNALREEYGEDAFGKQYDQLRWDMDNVLQKNLEVESFTATVGGAVNRLRHAVSGYEYSNKYPEGSVIKAVKAGLEVKGNIIRQAECIVSKGSEEEEQKKKKE